MFHKMLSLVPAVLFFRFPLSLILQGNTFVPRHHPLPPPLLGNQTQGGSWYRPQQLVLLPFVSQTP